MCAGLTTVAEPIVVFTPTAHKMQFGAPWVKHVTKVASILSRYGIPLFQPHAWTNLQINGARQVLAARNNIDILLRMFQGAMRLLDFIYFRA